MPLMADYVVYIGLTGVSIFILKVCPSWHVNAAINQTANHASCTGQAAFSMTYYLGLTLSNVMQYLGL